MTVVDGGHSTNYIHNIWDLNDLAMRQQDTQLLNIKSCRLPTLTDKTDHLQPSSDGQQVARGETADNHEVRGAATSTCNAEFRNRLRLGIYKGTSTCVATDPEHHKQLVKEKLAMHQQRTRPRTPITLEPLNVLPLGKPQATKVKEKNPRLTRSAPELEQKRTSKQELSSHLSFSMASENPFQLPFLSRESNPIRGNASRVSEPSSASGSEPVATTLPTNYFINSPEPRLQIISSSKMNQLKTSRQTRNGAKPLHQSLRTSQSSYVALREQRLLSEKLRAFDSENLLVSAQSFQQKDFDGVLDLVEQAQQNQLKCPKLNGKRTCGICPPTAGTVRKGRAASAHFPELMDSDQSESGGKTKKALIVQLPDILNSRSNTPFL